jgi:hypothetical protein
MYARRLSQLVVDFVQPLSAVLSAADLEICFPIMSLLMELHSISFSGRREKVGEELCVLARKSEPLYAGHILAFDKAIKALAALPPNAKDIVSKAVNKQTNKRDAGK